MQGWKDVNRPQDLSYIYYPNLMCLSFLLPSFDVLGVPTYVAPSICVDMLLCGSPFNGCSGVYYSVGVLGCLPQPLY